MAHGSWAHVYLNGSFYKCRSPAHWRGNRNLLLTRYFCTCSTCFYKTFRQHYARDHSRECTKARYSSHASESHCTRPGTWERGCELDLFLFWLSGFPKLGFRRFSLGSEIRLTALILAMEAKERPDCLNFPSSASFWTSLHWSWKCRETQNNTWQTFLSPSPFPSILPVPSFPQELHPWPKDILMVI